MKAVESFGSLLRKGATLGDATRASWLSTAMRKAKLYDPNDSLTTVVDMEQTRYDEAAGMTLPYPAWEDDPVAKALHDSLVPVQQKAEMLNQIWEGVSKRRDEAAREEQCRRSEAQGQPKVPCFEIQYAPEYSAPPRVEFIDAGKSK